MIFGKGPPLLCVFVCAKDKNNFKDVTHDYIKWLLWFHLSVVCQSNNSLTWINQKYPLRIWCRIAYPVRYTFSNHELSLQVQCAGASTVCRSSAKRSPIYTSGTLSRDSLPCFVTSGLSVNGWWRRACVSSLKLSGRVWDELLKRLSLMPVTVWATLHARTWSSPVSRSSIVLGMSKGLRRQTYNTRWKPKVLCLQAAWSYEWMPGRSFLTWKTFSLHSISSPHHSESVYHICKIRSILPPFSYSYVNKPLQLLRSSGYFLTYFLASSTISVILVVCSYLVRRIGFHLLELG